MPQDARSLYLIDALAALGEDDVARLVEASVTAREVTKTSRGPRRTIATLAIRSSR